ncbi:hypothetical protein [Candidatus Manganitrophus noduliformans]|uniref:Uncharacterized protein n=1 Tax=Candidatus Manganitrophus noduliformans TaxID=2606439 RepID=A0A7X6ICX2_9BACT|nr:hypothetical protein [Candidatus Manganitrophus noduliformans]NKE72996.1 hypothetical protein [Candidatus Manganitrophus noduliformans]
MTLSVAIKMRPSILIGILFLALSVHAADPVSAKLEAIYAQYEALAVEDGEKRIEGLIRLDQELRKLIDKPWTVENRPIDGDLWMKKYSTLGVTIGHYSGSLQYTGKLLEEAKKLDVKSQYSSYTDYADIFSGAGSFSGAFGMPNIEAALKYEEKFPKGPFIEDTLIIIGNFYDDLYKTLKIEETETSSESKGPCHSEYINKSPGIEKAEAAKQMAIKYYAKILALGTENKASNAAIAMWKKSLERGSSAGWHFCSD